MPDPIQRQPSEDEGPEAIHHASFVLRCWTGAGGQIRARLIDVQSGVSLPVADLADLPGQIRSLMARSMPAGPGSQVPI
jgi:hypothetical protein